MDALVLDPSYKTIGIVDGYDTFIWTERYNTVGDFELHFFPTEEVFEIYQEGNYILLRDSPEIGIIEDIDFETDEDTGITVVFKGRMWTSVLDRRILWMTQTMNSYLEDVIRVLMNICVISPSDNNRKISNIIFAKNPKYDFTGMLISQQYTGTNLLTVISDLCQQFDVGFRLTRTATLGQFQMQLYMGEDRSYGQSKNRYVVFSPQYENLNSSSYIRSSRPYKNVTLVGGEGQYPAQRFSYAGSTQATGMDRREIYTDASSVTSGDGDSKIDDTTYNNMLVAKGNETLQANARTVTFDGKIEQAADFQYGVHFTMGDIVQVENEYGVRGISRVVEFIRSDSSAGEQAYPTLQSINP